MSALQIRTATVVVNLVLTILIVSPGSSAEVVATDRHLVRYDNGIVYDAQAGLEWLAGPDQDMTWAETQKWVSGLSAAGGGWRMPLQRELKTLYHVGDGVNNITDLLSNSGYWFWAGQTETTAAKWLFSFSYGGEGWGGEAPPDGGRGIAVRLKKE